MNNLRDRIAAWWSGRAVDPIGAGFTKMDAWRNQPVNLADLFVRASVLHFPVRHRRKNFYRSASNRHSTPDIASPVVLQKGISGEFSGFSPYQPGDDPRHIDWRATARTREPMTRQWEGESQQPIVIVVDVSASLWFEFQRSTDHRPIDRALDLAVLIAAAGLARQAPVDILLVSDRVELHLERLQGRSRLGRIVEEFRGFQPRGRQTDWSGVGGNLWKIRPGAWLFWISDFLWLPEPEGFCRDYQRFQSFGLRVRQKYELSDADQVNIFDIETGSRLTHDQAGGLAKVDERLSRWSVWSGLPICDMPEGAERPELYLAEWLAGGFRLPCT